MKVTKRLVVLRERLKNETDKTVRAELRRRIKILDQLRKGKHGVVR